METSTQSLQISSPVGGIKIMAQGEYLTGISFLKNSPDKESKSGSSTLNKARQQLREYFNGERKSFDLELEPHGSEFECQVWNVLKKINYGSTITYAELAGRLGDPNKVRAVGRANGQNPLPIVIPCHRVIGANNKLTGYSGGIERKRWLLQHEGAILL